MSNENGKNAQVVEAEKQEKVDPLSQPIEVPNKLKKLAKSVGLDVDAVVERTNLIQKRILGLEQGIMLIANGLDARDKSLAPLVNLAKEIEERRKAMAQASQQTRQQFAPQGGGGLGGLGSILGGLKEAGIIGGESENPLMKAFMQSVFNAGIENMFMGSALVKTIVTKVAPEMYAEAIKKATETISKSGATQ